MDLLFLTTEFFAVLVAHAVSGIYSSTLKYSKKTTYIIWGIWLILQSMLFLYTEFVLTSQILQFITGFVLALIGQYIIFFATTKGKLGQRIFTIMTYSIFFCIAMALFMIVKGTFSNMHPFLSVLVQYSMLFGIVFYFLRYVCPLCCAAAKNITTGWTPLIFVNVVFLITIILSSVFPVKLTNFNHPAFITFVFISVSIMSVYPVIFISIKNMAALAYEKNKRLNAELLQSQVLSQEREVAAAKQARHDLRHHNSQMLAFLEEKNYDELKKYLLTYTNHIEYDDLIRFCENETINNILRIYTQKAKTNNIKMDIVALAEKDLAITSNDIVTILANIVENAYNGALESRHANPYITVNIGRMHGKLIMRCINSCKNTLSFENEMPESLQGIGINSIISTVEKYDGDCRFTAKNGEFSCAVIIEI